VAALATVLASLGVAGRLGLTADELAQLGTGLVALAVLGRAAWQAWRAEPSAPAAVEAVDVAEEASATISELEEALVALARSGGVPESRVRATVDAIQTALAAGRPVVERHLRPEAP